jgi:hypothetical protein
MRINNTTVPDDWSDAMRGSFEAACARSLQHEIDEGGVVKAGQFGQTVIQFADHYKIGSGLGWAVNRGEWKPLPTFAGEHPVEPGLVVDEIIWRERDGWMFRWSGEKWINMLGGDYAA